MKTACFVTPREAGVHCGSGTQWIPAFRQGRIVAFVIEPARQKVWSARDVQLVKAPEVPVVDEIPRRVPIRVDLNDDGNRSRSATRRTPRGPVCRLL